MYKIVYLLDIVLPIAGTLHYSSRYDDSIPEYYPKISLDTPPRIVQALPDPLSGTQPDENASVELSNVKQVDDTATEGKTLSQILLSEDPIGVEATLRLYDLNTGDTIVRLDGIIIDIILRQETATITIRNTALDVFQELIPIRSTLDYFPSTDLTTIRSSQNHSIIIPHGIMRKAPLALVHQNYIDHSFFKKAIIGDNNIFIDDTNISNYTIIDGDILYYDVCWHESNAQIALDLQATDGTTLRAQTNAEDQNGYATHPSTTIPDELILNRWYRREIALSSLVGKTINKFMVGNSATAEGTYTGKIANAIIVSGVGVVQRVIFDQDSSDPTYTVVSTDSVDNTNTATRRKVWDYGAIRKEVAGNITIPTVYRDGRVVASSEYTLEEPVSGYRVIRFLRDQRENGRLLPILVDIITTEFDSDFAKVARFYLENEDYGLGLDVDASVFSQASTDYSSIGYTLGGGLSSQEIASEVFNRLAVRGAKYVRDTNNNYGMFVDKASLHNAELSLGQGDEEGWQNIEVQEETHLSLDSRVRGIDAEGLYDPGLDSNPSWLLKTRRIRDIKGKIQTYRNASINNIDVLDKEASYLLKRLSYLERTLDVLATQEAKDILPNDLVDVYVPNMRYAGTSMEIREKTWNGVEISLVLARYDSDIYVYDKGSNRRVDPRALVLTNYSLTPPEKPINFTATTEEPRKGNDGSLEAILKLSADAPPVNVSHLSFRIYQAGQSIPVVVSGLLDVLPSQAKHQI